MKRLVLLLLLLGGLLTASAQSSLLPVTHTVVAGESLYGIGRQYGVSVAELLQANHLDETAILSIGQELIIPAKTEAADSAVVLEESATQLAVENPSELPVRVVYLLPLMLQHTVTADGLGIATVQQKNPNGTTYRQAVVETQKLQRFVEFYQGSLLALEELAAAGMHIDVQTYDIGKTAAEIQQVLDSMPAIRTADLIFGVTYPEQVQALSNYSFQQHIYTVLPVSSQVPDLQVNPYLIQFNATDGELIAKKVEFLKQRAAKGANLVFVHVAEEDASDAAQLKQALQVAGVKFQEQAVMEVPTAEALALKLDSTRENCLIFNVAKSAKADSWIKFFNQELIRYDIYCLSDYQWVVRKDKIPVPFYFPSLFRTENDDMEQYQEKYETYFAAQNLSGSTPRYDELGYDLSKLFLTVMHNNRARFGDNLPATKFIGVSITPDFHRVGSQGGFRNQGVKFYRTDVYGTFLAM